MTNESAIVFGWPVINFPPQLTGTDQFGRLGDILLTNVASVPMPVVTSETIAFSKGLETSQHCVASWPYIEDESGWFPNGISNSAVGPGFGTKIANTLVPIDITLADVTPIDDDLIFQFDYISIWAQSTIAIYDEFGKYQIASSPGSTQRSTVTVTVPASRLAGGQSRFQLLVDPGMVYGLTIQGDMDSVSVSASYYWSSVCNGENPAGMNYIFNWTWSEGVSSTDTETRQFAESIGLEVSTAAGALFAKISAKLTANFTATQTNQTAIQLTKITTEARTFTAPLASYDLTFVIWQLKFRFDSPSASLKTWQSDSPLIIGRTYPDPPPKAIVGAADIQFG